MSQRDQAQPPRFCRNCGAKAVAGVSHCPSCGQPLAQREELARLWGVDPDSQPPDESTIIDLYPEDDASLQTTTPFTQTRPFQPADRPAAEGESSSFDPWSSKGGTLGKRATTPSSPPPTAAVAPTPARRGPHGCLLGCLALLIIAAVGALLTWGAVRPYVSDRIEDELAVGLSNEIRGIDPLEPSVSGRIALTEAEINADLAENAQAYEPIEQVSVSIDEDEIAVAFELYGLSSTLRGGLTVDDGRLTVVDPSLGGAAGRIIDADEIADVFEREVAELLRRSNLRPTRVQLREDSLVLTTEPAA